MSIIIFMVITLIILISIVFLSKSSKSLFIYFLSYEYLYPFFFLQSLHYSISPFLSYFIHTRGLM